MIRKWLIERLMWRLLAITDAPFTERAPTEEELKAHLETLPLARQIELTLIIKAWQFLKTGEQER